MIKAITLPNSITKIEYLAFDGCSNLKSVHFEGTLDQWVNIDFKTPNSNPLNSGGQFYLYNKEVTNATLTNNVTEIKNNAFYNCQSLTSITIPSSVTGIGDSAFGGCNNLTDIIFEENSKLIKIEGWAFKDCSSLQA